MSLDYPNRADWLKFRKPRVNRPRLAFLAADVGRREITLAGGHKLDVPVVITADTFKAGRNAAKRVARRDQRAKRWAQVNKWLAAGIGALRCRKFKLSPLLTTLFADRRLRQRQCAVVGQR